MQRLRKLSSSISDLFRNDVAETIENDDKETIIQRFPLHTACVFANSVEVEFLLSFGQSSVDLEDDKGRIPLHYSVQHENVYISKLLISKGANVDSIDFAESTPSHFAAKEGQVQNACLLLSHGADFCARDKMGRTAVDITCEEGHLEFTKLMIEQGCVSKLIGILAKQSRISTTSPLHLAARNGHVEIVSMLINDANFPLNFVTLNGSALHEAIRNEQLQVVRLLLHHGIDLSLTDHRKKTALELVNLLFRHNPVSSPLILELIQESCEKTYGIAIRDFHRKAENLQFQKKNRPSFGLQLPLKAGDVVWILGYTANSNQNYFLRGITFSLKGFSCCGYFPKKAVRILNYPDKAQKKAMVHRKSLGACKMKVKKVDIPTIPGEDKLETLFNTSNTTDYHTDSGSNASDRNSYYTNSSAPITGLSPTPSRTGSFYDGASFPDNEYSDSVQFMSRSCSTAIQHANSFGALTNGHEYSDSSIEKYRNVPSSSSICSQFSGHSSSCLTDNYSGRVTATLSSIASRSSNALVPGSSTTPIATPYRLAQVLPNISVRHRVAEMVGRGIPEVEIMTDWLKNIGFPQYLSMFCLHGYDLASISRVTPQDLIAIGITKPDHRREIIRDIHNWNITDGYPSFIPSSNGIRDFLSAIGLPEYIEKFESQSCTTIKELEELSWEDFEEIGVRKLGHIKRLTIALKKLKTSRESRMKNNSVAEGQHQHQSYNYPNGTLTSRSTSALEDPMRTFENVGTLRKETRNSLPVPNFENRHRPVVPVLPHHHVPRKIETDYTDNFELKKPPKLNLMMKEEILSKLDDLDGDNCGPSFHDDLPPSPAPIAHYSAIDRLYAVTFPRDEDYFHNYQNIPRGCHHMDPCMDDLNDLGQMLQDLTDELDAKLTSTTV